MVVPFIYNLHDIGESIPNFLWVFYKFLDFCNKNKMPIIAQEDMFKPVEYYEENNHYAVKYNDFDYDYPQTNTVNSILSYKIKKSFDEKIIGNKDSFEVWCSIVKKRNKTLENEINKAFDTLEKKTNKKIECVICWMTFESLQFVCKERGIVLLNYELSSIRKGHNYNQNIGYFSFGTKYTQAQIKKNYTDFDSNLLFQRDELLNLFLTDNCLEYINKINEAPIYDFGIATGLKQDVIETSVSHVKLEEISSSLAELVGVKNVLMRTHPANPIELKDYPFVKDDSPSSIDWLLKCKRVVNNVSNIGFEAMLYGKTSYVLSKDMPFYFNNINNLNLLEEHVADLKYLNYIVFGFFAPFDLMFDLKYIKWRLTNPKINDIYNKNMEYILNKVGLNKDIFTKKNKFEIILNACHKDVSFKKKSINSYYIDNVKKIESLEKNVQSLNRNIDLANENIISLNQQNTLMNKKLEESNLQNHELNEINISLSNEISAILNSKSWKLTKPLRKITSKLSKK